LPVVGRLALGALDRLGVHGEVFRIIPLGNQSDKLFFRFGKIEPAGEIPPQAKMQIFSLRRPKIFFEKILECRREKDDLLNRICSLYKNQFFPALFVIRNSP
jgi:hypothetical protein